MPERLGQWVLLDRTGDPVVADVGVVRDKVSHYRTLADGMRTSADRLHRIASGQELVGHYADELRSSAGQVAEDLGRVVGRYDAAASALDAYEPELEHALAESAAALDDAVAADGAARAAAGMPTAQASDGQPLTSDQQAQNDEKSARTRQAADQLSAARARLDRALGGLDDAGRRAAGVIRQGFGDGLKDSSWDRFVHAFMKFLKILVKVLTYIAMALAVIALVIPGLGEAILAIGVAIAAVTVVANGILAATGNGSWADFGIAIAGLLTFGVGKVLGPAIQKVLKTVGTAVKNSVGGATGVARGSSHVEEDMIPLLNRSKNDWGIPKSATKASDQELAINNEFRMGSWQDASGTIYTRLSNLKMFKGVNPQRAEHYLDGVRKEGGSASNGNGNPNWKAFYGADDRNMADDYAKISSDATGKAEDGVVLEYQHGKAVTVVTPARGFGDGEEELLRARQLFGQDDDAMFVDQLGNDGYILRNDLGPEGFEYVVPWTNVNTDGASILGRWNSDGKFDWVWASGAAPKPAAGFNGLRQRALTDVRD